MEHDTDNSLPFVKLAALTANVLRHLGLDKKQEENSDDEAKRRDERERYIQQRSAEIRRFEEIAKGIVPNASRRKRKAD